MAIVSLGREAEEKIRRDRFSSFVLLVCLFSILSQASLILVSWGKLPPQLPLFYSRPWGEMLLAPTVGIWILPGILLLSFVINYGLVIFAVSFDRFLTRVLLTFSLIAALSTLFSAVKIISLLV